MANHWNHYSKHGALETLRHIHINRSCIADYHQQSYKNRPVDNATIPELTTSTGATLKVRATPCNYGGYRFWFVCPGCNGNRLILRYVEKQNKFYCNSCLNGVHHVTQMSKSDRRFNRRAGIRERLGLERRHGLDDRIWGWHKPKGMHWKTFYPLMQKHNDLLEVDSQLWVKSCQRFFPGMFNDLR